MNTIIAIISLAVLALVGWCVAEWKNKHMNYQPTETETKAEEAALDAARSADFSEKNIHDVIETISTKGFAAGD